jgi:hypothetical protein
MVTFYTIVGTNGSFKVKFETLYEKIDSSICTYCITMGNNME